MAYGFEVYNVSGELRLGASDRLVKFHSEVSGTIPDGTSEPVFVSIPGVVAADPNWTVGAVNGGIAAQSYYDYEVVDGGVLIDNIVNESGFLDYVPYTFRAFVG